MANISMILGKSGTGKSTSVKNLDPKETLVISVVENKKLPFKGSSKVYSKENKNWLNKSEWADIVATLKAIDKNMPNVKNIIIDDFTYVMRKEYFKRATENGYGKYTELAQHIQSIINTCEQMNAETNVFIIWHAEELQSDKITTGYKLSTIGNLLDSQYNPIEVVPMVLFSDVKFDEQGNPSYGFYTHRCISSNNIVIPAKSPEGMFTEDFIPNDLSVVIKAMNEYYN